MKKYILLLCVTLSLMASCQSNEEQLKEEASIQNLVSSKYGITLETEEEKYETSNSEIIVNIQNESDIPLTFGEEFAIEKNIDGTWYVVPFKEGMDLFDAVGKSLEPKSSTTQTLSLDRLENSLIPGEYRLVKNFYDPSDYFFDKKEKKLGGGTLAAPFEVTN
ncbi:immunoglobulin-like domain-containing protein [Domibacillus mangrovi]|uniref:Bacterial Ig-like domain-containing protein n=1 Tax=Domibacillus mangrovi TaxID=1714354 RepID=A0A1Q5NZF7_9BACI|nr:immunoglobulin-like domain-containing protein [Domibacillus mangrovi]OKL35298.1 hypothetical protein BLL40_16245 [Domibacillus mangrovi]